MRLSVLILSVLFLSGCGVPQTGSSIEANPTHVTDLTCGQFIKEMTLVGAIDAAASQLESDFTIKFSNAFYVIDTTDCRSKILQYGAP